MKDIRSLNIYQLALDQESLMFTGRINVLNRTTSEMIGTVTFIDGEICTTKYKNTYNLNALVLIFFEESKYTNLKYLIEPEILKDSISNTRMKFSDILPDIEGSYSDMWNSAALRPSNDLIFLLNGDFLVKGADINKDEFSMMKVIVDFNQVSDIYANSSFEDHFTTMNLVSLRKKGALKVIKYK